MVEKDELRASLVNSLLNAANVEERVKIMNVLNQYDSNTNERKKNEQKLRLDQDIHEDDLRKDRDQAIIDDRRHRWEVTKDVINIVFKALGGVATLALIAKYLRDDKNGEPMFGPIKDIAAALVRKWF